MEYITYVLKIDNGTEPITEWLRNELKDKTAVSRISSRMEMVEDGNFGDHKYLDQGVSELRMDFGPGYRVYYNVSGNIVVFICGGIKRTQKKDIKKAIRYWRVYENI